MDSVKGSNPAYVPDQSRSSPALTTPLLNAHMPAKDGLEIAQPSCGMKQCCWMRRGNGRCGKGRCVWAAGAAFALFLAFAVSLGVWAHSSRAVITNAVEALSALGINWDSEDIEHVRCHICGSAMQYGFTLLVALGFAVGRAKLQKRMAVQGTVTRKAKAVHIGLTAGFHTLFWLVLVWIVMALVIDYMAAGVVFWTWQLTQTSLASMDTYGTAVAVAGQPCPGQCLDLNTYAWMDKEHFGDVCVCEREQVQAAADILFEARRPFAHVAGSIWTAFATALLMFLITISFAAKHSARTRARHMHNVAQGTEVTCAYGAIVNGASAAPNKADAV